ncbi:hypothetical protein J6590_093860 [Homalodisca vitripennis]|nr:hypothetical protein J6590_093860 [Homalodisca vitripennis]
MSSQDADYRACESISTFNNYYVRILPLCDDQISRQVIIPLLSTLLRDLTFPTVVEQLLSSTDQPASNKAAIRIHVARRIFMRVVAALYDESVSFRVMKMNLRQAVETMTFSTSSTQLKQ